MYWTLELASYLEEAPWPATRDELIDYAIRSGSPLEVIENLQEIQGDEPLKEGAYYYTQPTERVKSTKNVAVKFCIKKYDVYI